MDPRTIRWLDYWLGVPLCRFLTLCRLVMPARRGEARSILFLKFIEQGATVLAQDAVGRAAAQVGRDHVYFCVFESNRAILEVLDIVPRANIITIRDRRLLQCLADFVRALVTIRARRIDAVIDMEFFSRASAIFAFLSGARTRVGLHRFTSEFPDRGDLMTHRVHYNPYLHVSTQYSLLVVASRLDPEEMPMLKVPPALLQVGPQPPPPCQFNPTEEESGQMRARLVAAMTGGAGSSIGPGQVVLINPNASDLLPLRKWAGDRFVDLARRVVAAYPDALVVVTGAPSERQTADALCAAIGSNRAVSFAGQTTLRELLTLYTLSDVMVTNDSGPAHFASLTRMRTVVLFGPETPQLFGSLSPSTTVIWKALACSPCVSVFNHRLSPCQNNVCMQAITVDEVYAAVSAHLTPSRAKA